MQNIFNPYAPGGVPLYANSPPALQQRTQKESQLLALINPGVGSQAAPTAPMAASAYVPAPELVYESPAVEEEEEEEADNDGLLSSDSDLDDADPPTSTPAPLPTAAPLNPAPVLTRKQVLKKAAKKERKDRILAANRGALLHTITSESLQPIEEPVTWDSDPELLCSYNWAAAEDGTNTLFVPGGPPKWTPRTLPCVLKGDSGFHPTDYNYVRQPKEPYSAVFHALGVMRPDFNWYVLFSNTDLLCDRNNLRILLEFTQGKTSGPFRLDAYLVGPTLLLVRREDGFWKRSDGKSYGFNFESAFTASRPDMADATSHYRAIRYKMGPLNVVCRFEADAYVDDSDDFLQEAEKAAVTGEMKAPTSTSNSNSNRTTKPDPKSKSQPQTNPNDLPTAGLANRPNFTYRAPFRVLQKGSIIPSSQILELKTQAEKGDKNSLVACQDQLWFGRTPHLFTGRYESATTTSAKNTAPLGTILYVKHEAATSRVARWEDREQASLRRLVTLLIHIRTLLAAQPGPVRAAVLVREDPRGPLSVWEMVDRWRVVPQGMVGKFWGQGYGQGGGGGRGRGGMGGRGGAGVGRGMSAFRAQRGGFAGVRSYVDGQGYQPQHQPQPQHGYQAQGYQAQHPHQAQQSQGQQQHQAQQFQQLQPPQVQQAHHQAGRGRGRGRGRGGHGQGRGRGGAPSGPGGV